MPMTDSEYDRQVALLIAGLDQHIAGLDAGDERSASTVRLMLAMVARDGSTHMLAGIARALRDSFTDREQLVCDAAAEEMLDDLDQYD